MPLRSQEIGRALAAAAFEIQAIKINPTEPFRWASGYHMPIYNDNRMFLGNAKHRALIADGFVAIAQEKQLEFDVIGGTATAGIPPAVTLSDRMQKPLVYIRDKNKDHGMRNRIEGILQSGQRVLVVEDVVSTGGSSVAAVEGVREAGGLVDHCFAIYHYGFEKAESLFRNASCGLHSLLTFRTLLDVALEKGALNDKQKSIVEEWQTDPFGWGAKHGFPTPEK